MTHTRRILLVDDQPEMLYYLKLTLEKSGEYETLTAHDGAEALQILHSQPVDMVITDIAMP